jgi:hypothetical protein
MAVWHTISHEPQCCALICRSKHSPPQELKPGPHEPPLPELPPDAPALPPELLPPLVEPEVPPVMEPP